MPGLCCAPLAKSIASPPTAPNARAKLTLFELGSHREDVFVVFVIVEATFETVSEAEILGLNLLFQIISGKRNMLQWHQGCYGPALRDETGFVTGWEGFFKRIFEENPSYKSCLEFF